MNPSQMSANSSLLTNADVTLPRLHCFHLICVQAGAPRQQAIVSSQAGMGCDRPPGSVEPAQHGSRGSYASQVGTFIVAVVGDPRSLATIDVNVCLLLTYDLETRQDVRVWVNSRCRTRGRMTVTELSLKSS